jgi:hypothetical protein
MLVEQRQKLHLVLLASGRDKTSTFETLLHELVHVLQPKTRITTYLHEDFAALFLDTPARNLGELVAFNRNAVNSFLNKSLDTVPEDKIGAVLAMTSYDGHLEQQAYGLVAKHGSRLGLPQSIVDENKETAIAYARSQKALEDLAVRHNYPNARMRI